MIENEFELNVLIKDDLSDKPVSTKATFEFKDIKHYYKYIYYGEETTVIVLPEKDEAIIDLSYEKFKEKYNKLREEIKGQRP